MLPGLVDRGSGDADTLGNSPLRTQFLWLRPLAVLKQRRHGLGRVEV